MHNGLSDQVVLAVNTDAAKQVRSLLHPGALPYYQEAGWTIPDPIVFQK